MVYLIVGELMMLGFLLKPSFVDAMATSFSADKERRKWHVYTAFAFSVVAWPLVLISGIAYGIKLALDD